ncbi:MAG: HAMP domain-containing protein [Alphaproteobacteria bacterium]|nr:HAMP domain-containing protein [Alphaproteobacteria bacterium]
MNGQTSVKLLGRFSIAQKLGLAAACGMATIAIIVGYTFFAVDAHRWDGNVIDLAGRQRMLIQSAAKDVLLNAAGAQASPEAALKTFEQTLEALVNGGTAVENLATGSTIVLAPAGLSDAQSSYARQKALIQEFRTVAAAYMSLPATDSRRTAKLSELTQVTQSLSSAADEFVQNIDMQADRKLGVVMRNDIFLGMLACLGAIIMTLVIGRNIVLPLKACVARSWDIAEGNLKVDPLPVLSQDEIGMLSAGFNNMVESLRDIAARTRMVTENLNASAAEIFATTKEQAAATRQQAAAVQQITATVEEINQSGKQVAERAKQVSGSAQSMTNASNLGLQAVESIVKAMEGIRHQAGTVADNIVTLSERTQAIGEIIATVTDIAEQSNLVALNAAIEAADAREDGRRFAVVANEIKNLADQAKDATRRVRNILEEIQRGINTSVLLTEEAMKRVEYGREKVTVADEAIRKMTANVAESANAFQQIGGATNQQQIGFEQVVQALQEIRQASQQTASSTGQLESAAGGFNSLSQELRAVIEKYRV